MEVQSKTRTEQILKIMLILTWIAFIGLLIEAGAILVSYLVSWANPEAAKDLYQGLDWYPLRQLNFWYYTQAISFKIALPIMKALMCFWLIKILSKVNLKIPFSPQVVRGLERISYALLGVCLVAVFNNLHVAWLAKKTGIILGEFPFEEFLFVAGLVFILSQVFKRGVEIQSENELTI